MKKSVISVILLCLVLCLCPALCRDVYAEDNGALCCGTDPKLVQELYSGLVSRKLSEMNDDGSLEAFGLQPYQTGIGLAGQTLRMPSKGDVKVLVLPMEFADCKFDAETSAVMNQAYFGESDLSVSRVNESMRTFFRRVSFDQLRLTGTVLPIYSLPENQDYYKDEQWGGRYLNDAFSQEVQKALRSYESVIGDLSDYDLDGNGAVDCVVVQIYGALEGVVGYVSSMHYPELYDNFKLSDYAVVRGDYLFRYEAAAIACHEIGHLMGLPDNYSGSVCVIPASCNDLMSGADAFPDVNVYYRYLLDWEEPEIVPYTDGPVRWWDLYASDKHMEDQVNKRTSILFLCAPKNSYAHHMLPFGEFYIAEFRSNAYGHIYRDYETGEIKYFSPGIIIWHINLETDPANPIAGYLTKNYIVPVFKDGTTFYSDGTPMYTDKDMYKAGDRWSDTTTPSSDLYSGTRTGAYLRVKYMDDDKATVSVCYVEPDMAPAPTMTLQTEKKYVNRKQDIWWPYSLDDGAELGARVFQYVHVKTTGTVGQVIPGHSAPTDAPAFFAYGPAGDGTVQLVIAPGLVRRGNIYDSVGTVSDIVIVDNTPPNITLNGAGEVGVPCGTEYVELGATVTDNLDPEIADSMVIDASQVNTHKNGVYKVRYTAVDQAGNKAEAVRTVRVFTAYQVSLVVNGGTLPQALTFYAQGEGATLPIPERAGYSFGGWYDNPAFTGSAVSVISSKDTGDKTFYARWTAPLRLITNGGALSQTPTSYTQGVETALPAPTKVGYRFGGWYDNAALEGAAITGISAADTGAKTFYAKWSVCSHDTCNEHVSTQPTCTSFGWKGYRCLDCGRFWQERMEMLPHTTGPWTDSGAFHQRVCSVCQQAATAAHVEDSGTVSRAPTAEEAGERTICCRVCGHVMRREEIPRLEPGHRHSYSLEWRSDATGHWHECVCGDRNGQTAHVPVTDPAVGATCSEPGKTEGSHCDVCGYILVPQVVVPASGHSYSSEWHSDAAAHWRECVCGEQGERGAHSYGGWVTVRAATGTTVGSRERRCTVCGYTQTEDIPVIDGGYIPSGNEPGPVMQPTASFTDVQENHWAAKAIRYVVEKGLMYGVDDERFAPDAEISRAMVVTVLYRLEGEPSVSVASGFSDVGEGRYDSQAVAWAAANHIVVGLTPTSFAPDDPITREQLLAVLLRYTEYKGLNADTVSSLRGFTDHAEVSGFAQRALGWAVGTNIIQGSAGKLHPADGTTRAEAAAIFMRYCEGILK